MNALGKEIKAIALEVEALQEKACRLSYKFIEDEARKTMAKSPSIKSFVMAMGRAFFCDKNGKSIARDRPMVKPFYEKADGLNGLYGVYGWPMKINGKDGAVIHDW